MEDQAQRHKGTEAQSGAADAIMEAADRVSLWVARWGLPVLVGIALGYAWRMAQGF